MDVGGNGRMFSARTEQDAKLFAKELELRDRPRPGRRRQLVAFVITGLLVVGVLVVGVVAS